MSDAEVIEHINNSLSNSTDDPEEKGGVNVLDKTSKMVYILRTDSSGNNVISEHIGFTHDGFFSPKEYKNVVYYLELHAHKQSSIEDVYESSYMPVSKDATGTLYMRIEKPFSFALDSLNNKNMLIDPADGEVEKALDQLKN